MKGISLQTECRRQSTAQPMRGTLVPHAKDHRKPPEMHSATKPPADIRVSNRNMTRNK